MNPAWLHPFHVFSGTDEEDFCSSHWLFALTRCYSLSTAMDYPLSQPTFVTFIWIFPQGKSLYQSIPQSCQTLDAE